ncbi:DUF1016 N-terminal domain-containing protein [Arthrobacter sp. CAN_A214]|uniref:DUF1016 N-terminal domain-containing protein n=1 Tax=Arthrobacter sp. CAN_A214 TaxID=2787720 RepID=UPI002FF2001E
MVRTDVVLPDGYASTLDALKRRVRDAQFRVQRTVNTQLIELYWNIGNEILAQQVRQGWGTGVVKQLAADLRAEFPQMKDLFPKQFAVHVRLPGRTSSQFPSRLLGNCHGVTSWS